MRVLVVSGKGGVGKTTVSAATAARCAADGLRTLVVSTDGAHSLADVFGQPLGHDPTEIGPNLWGQQVDTRLALEETWVDIRDYIADLLCWAGADGLVAEELLVVPGMHEVFALDNVLVQASSGRFDRIVVDCAPTAETLRLLELPEALQWYLDRLFPAHRRLARFTRPMLKRAVDMPLAQDHIFEAVLRFTSRMREVRSMLVDPERSSIRLVTTTERIVLDEARRLYSNLCLFDYPVDGLVVNRLLPDSERGTPLLDEWQGRQERQLAKVPEDFPGTSLWNLELRAGEPTGLAALTQLGNELYGETDPMASSPVDRPVQFTECDDTVVMSVHMPGYDPSAIDVKSAQGELIITAGGQRRAILLPEGVRAFGTTGANYDGTKLEIRLARPCEREVAHVG